MKSKGPLNYYSQLIGFLLFATFILSQCGRSNQRGELPDIVDFNYHIKPLLSDRCFACHGPDEKAREAKLSLHTKEGAFAVMDGESSRFIISPGNLDQSEVYHRIMSDDPEYMMPPPESNLALSEYDKNLIAKWIEQGATWKKHWAFIPPEKPKVPDIRDTDWKKNAIDAFVFAKMKEKRLTPNPEEAPEKWLRRVCFDLTGLPPDKDLIDHFKANHSEKDYEQIVDQLLSNPAYGERMASIWLDLSRYADSHGYQDDKPRSIWPWRDWVIKAFNNNQPYDQFVTEQLAGDLLAVPTYSQKLATAFNRNHPITQEGGVIDEEYRTEYAADRVQTFATSFLGITLQCARCHDHKYDPISQKDFYQLFSFFNSVEGERGQISYFDLAPAPNLPMQDTAYESYVESIKDHINQLESDLDLQEVSARKEFTEWKSNGNILNSIDIQKDLVADFQLDDEDWLFRDLVTSEGRGRANVNLPPSIDQPIKVRGHNGNALQFNGDNFVTLGEIGDFDHWNSFSISTWVNHAGSLRKDAAIFGRRNEEQYRQGYDCILLKNRQISFRLIHNLGAEKIEVRTLGKLTPGWHHLAITYDGSGIAGGVRIFLDGKKQEVRVIRDDLEGKSIANGNDFLIGHWNHRARIVNDQYGFAGGSVDELKIYQKQLTPLEVKTLAGWKTNEIKNSSYNEQFVHYLLRLSGQFNAIKYSLDSLRAIDTTIPTVMIMQEKDTLDPAFILDRGIYDAKLEPVERNTPNSILAFNQEEKNRLGLARWLFDTKNPLTARVMVNRLWQQCFGNGLVKTAEDFGNQGDLPTHPELLDWLATEFRDQGWNMQAILKMIVLSKTYRQSAKITPVSREKDPSNQWLARGPHRPLSAEMIRDQALKTSGLLFDKVGGKWVKPYQPPGIWKELANQIGENKYRVSQGRDKYRRSLYTYWKRTIPPPTMLTLDAPERSVCTVKRQATSTPLQALILLNDPTYLEASRHLAKKIWKQNSDLTGKLENAFTTIVGRYPQEQELEEMLTFLSDSENDLQSSPEEVQTLLSTGDSPPTEFDSPTQGAALTFTISLMYNLDEAKYH